MNPLTRLLCIGIICLLSSCAAPYKRINPSMLQYYQPENDGIFSYKYNVLRGAGNSKLSRKEEKRHINILAIKIYNNTGQPFVYEKNFKIYCGDREIRVLGPDITADVIRQKAPTYLLYLLLTPMTLETGESEPVPIGLVVGPGLAIGNMAVAASANKRFKEELKAHDILDREIADGETFYGLISIPDNGFAPLSLKLMK